MKKTALLMLLLALCLLVAPLAVAEGGPVARSDAFAAYVDGEGHLYLPGRAEPINGETADSVVAIDAYRALYMSPDDFQDTEDLYMIDLQSLEESRVAANVKAACLAGEDTAYYVSGANRKQLMRVDLRTLAAEVAYTAAEPIDRLYMSAEGLLFQLVDQAATMLYVEEKDRFEVYNGEMPRSGVTGDKYEIYLTDGSELYIKSCFNYSTTLVDTDVTAYARLNNAVFYLCRTGTVLRLKAYDLSTLKTRVVLTPGVKMKDQLTATAKGLFMLTADDTVCRVNTVKGTLAVFKRYADLSAYKLPADYEADGLRIEGMSGQLNVYVQLREKLSKPTFSFIEFESEADEAAPVLRLIDTLTIDGEETAWDLLKPAPQYTPLSMGSRGDAVTAIQQPLYDLGYYDYYVDGIFGPRTQAAVKLLQFDLDRPVTGVADAELQRIILSGKLSPYDPYLQLTRGNRGMRVQTMQERLRELGYLADAADGIFGPRTLKAVQLFQYENGLPESNTATRQTLKLLYSDSASPCSSYIDLFPGDTGYRVRELNNRLKALYYLECSPGSTYTCETTSAVRVFQRTAGLKETGRATEAVQRALFSDDAPEAPGYIVLRRGDDNDRVAALQRRLKELKYYNGPVDGYYGRETKDAVALFQKKVGLKPTGIATVRTQKLLFDDDAPEYVKPTIIGVPDIYVEDYEYEEDGIYYITEDSTANGYVIFDWDVEGSVDYYNVRVSDSEGYVYADNDTVMTSTAVSLATLEYGLEYTLRIKAYPEDGDKKHITQAEVTFVRIERLAEAIKDPLDGVGIPEIDMDTVARYESGVSYLLPGTVTFGWHAEGNVSSYIVRIEDESGDVIVDEDMTSLHASIRTDAMNAGEVYTISVYAVPESGDIREARSNSAQFALPEVELPEPEATPEPTPEPVAEVEEISGDVEIEASDAPEEDLEPVATFEPDPSVETESVDVDVDAGEPAQAVNESVAEPETDVPVSEAVPEESDGMPEETPEEEAPVAVPVETREETAGDEVPVSQPADMPEEAPAEQPVDMPEETTESEAPVGQPADEAPETGSLSAPVITIDYVQEEAGGVAYISGDVFTITWQTEGDVAEYHTELLDSSGNTLDDRIVTSPSLSAHTSALDPDEVYTLNVTAIPTGGTEADGVTASIRFALYTSAAQAGENPEADADDEEPADDSREDEEAYQISEEPADDGQEDEEAYQVPEEPADDGREDEKAYQEPEAYADNGREDEQASEESEEADDAEPQDEWQEPVEIYQGNEDDWQTPAEVYQESGDDAQEPVEVYTESGDDAQEPVEVYPEPENDADWPEPEDEFPEPEEVADGGAEGGEAVIDEYQINTLQAQLVSLGWLAEGDYTPGVLDSATVDAIASFQSYCLEAFDLDLPAIDPEDPVIDADTLNALTYANESYANPDA